MRQTNLCGAVAPCFFRDIPCRYENPLVKHPNPGRNPAAICGAHVIANRQLHHSGGRIGGVNLIQDVVLLVRPATSESQLEIEMINRSAGAT